MGCVNECPEKAIIILGKRVISRYSIKKIYLMFLKSFVRSDRGMIL